VRAPGISYRFLTPIDTSGPTFQPFQQVFLLTGSVAANVFVVDTIPKDKVLVLTNAVLYTTPDATQWVVAAYIEGRTAAGQNWKIARLVPGLVAGDEEAINWDGEVYLPGAGNGNITVRIYIQFDAIVQPNTMACDVHGIVVPRGNVAAY